MTARFAEAVTSPIKSLGGKRRLLPQLVPLLPEQIASMRYIEPFAGGASLFFALRPERAVLADANVAIMRTYVALRDDPKSVERNLRFYAGLHSADVYYRVRDEFNTKLGRLRRPGWRGQHTRRDSTCSVARFAAMFIYLNKTGYNGLCRFNRDGGYNVPMGRHKKPAILVPEALRSASRVLGVAELRHGDFRVTLGDARSGDFVYLDPPYAPVSSTAKFTNYTGDGFSDSDQEELRDRFVRLARRGVWCMLSNSDTPLIRKLYSPRELRKKIPGFNVRSIDAPRSVSCRGNGRGAVRELVIRSYT